MRCNGREEEAARVYGASVAVDRIVPLGSRRVALERDEEDLAGEIVSLFPLLPGSVYSLDLLL